MALEGARGALGVPEGSSVALEGARGVPNRLGPQAAPLACLSVELRGSA